MITRKIKIFCPSKIGFLDWYSVYSKSTNIGEAHQLFEDSDIKTCDFVVSPYPWTNNKNNQDTLTLSQSAKDCQKQIIIFHPEDLYDPINIDHAIIFRHALTASTRNKNEYIVPPFCDPSWLPAQVLPKHYVRQKQGKPTIGFCGDALTSFQNKGIIYNIKRLHQKIRHSMLANVKLDRWLQRFGFYLTKKPGNRIRTQSIIPLYKAQGIITNFLLRKGCCNGAKFDGSEEDKQLIAKSQKEYLDNMLGSDYILCPRGTGNFSCRFYETLCCGRIPIFINTDCVLPFENYVDWKKHFVWIDESEIEHLAQKILQFHHPLSDKEFVEIQNNCMKLWETYLSPAGFLKNLHRFLLDQCPTTINTRD